MINKKIAVLTYFSAYNFGANLQAFSTYNYLLNHGYSPIMINYKPDDWTYSTYPEQQQRMHDSMMALCAQSPVCRNAQDVAQFLSENEIKNVIIGSDAVCQHHPLLDRIVFPSKSIVSLASYSSDRMFPNPFWGTFIDDIDYNINIVMMSASSQQSNYRAISKNVKRQMFSYLEKFSYISVRDQWTKEMIENISQGKIKPQVTPDPVFGFNYNYKDIPSKDEILSKYGIPDNYVLLAIRKGRSVTNEWVSNFERICAAQGYTAVGLPFPYGYTDVNVLKEKIKYPLSPLDWYSLIKYAKGFVGHNMHTIVTSLHNNVPCYSFDQYGIRFLAQFCNNKSSKIFDILNEAGLSSNRAVSGTLINRIPSPEVVFERLFSAEKRVYEEFSEKKLKQYINMMTEITHSFI